MEEKSVKGGWVILLILVPVFIIVLPFLPFLWVTSIIHKFKERKRAKRFLRQRNGETFFFYTKKRSWGNFIQNNVLPALPASTHIFEVHSNPCHEWKVAQFLGNGKNISREERRLPLLVRIVNQGPIFCSLFPDFSPEKKNAKADEALQGKISRLIQKKLGLS